MGLFKKVQAEDAHQKVARIVGGLEEAKESLGSAVTELDQEEAILRAEAQEILEDAEATNKEKVKAEKVRRNLASLLGEDE